MAFGSSRAAAFLGLCLGLLSAACVTSPTPVTEEPAAAVVAPEEPTDEIPMPLEAAVEPPAVTAPAQALDALARQALEERNAAIVTAFYEMVFVGHQVAEAFDRYGGDVYIQHSPGAPDGRAAVEAALTPYFEANPLARSEIQRVIAQSDLVVLHVHAKADPVDRGRAVVEIFRVLDGKIVEHWDVIQTIPPSAANGNTMF